MKIPKEMMSQITNNVAQKWTKSRECNKCGEEKWTVSDQVFEMREFAVGSGEQGQILPMIVMTCNNCGNAEFFNAIKLGLKFSKKDESSLS